MRKSCFDRLVEIGFEVGLVPDRTITSFSDTSLREQLLDLLNRAKAYVVRKAPLDTLLRRTSFETIAEYTTGTLAITTNTTSVVGTLTVFTAEMVGRKIQIGSDKTPYTISEFIDTTHIEIDRPFVGTTETAGTYKIFQDVISLPPFVDRPLVIMNLSNEILRLRTPTWLNTRYPDPLRAAGNPGYWGVFGSKESIDPVDGSSYAADASTDADSIVEAGLANTTIQDYYKGWYVYNSTRKKWSRVDSYDISDTTLYLKTPITGQVATDAFYLKKVEKQIMFRPAKLSKIPLVVLYLKDATYFALDTDFEQEIDPDNEEVLFYRACAEFYLTKDKDRALTYVAMAQDIIEDIKTQNEEAATALYCFNGGEGRSNGPDLWNDSYSIKEYN